MDKNVLLVYPKIPKGTYWSFSHSMRFIDKKAAIAPLGIITVAAMMPEYNFKLVDENIEELKDEHLDWADIVFTSSMAVQSDSLEDIVKRVKKHNKKVVAGGPYPSQFYDRIDEQTDKAIDHFVLGEAESGVLAQFLSDLKKGNPKRAYARPVSRLRGQELIDKDNIKKMQEYFGKNSDIQMVSKRPDMELSPVPRFDLLKIKSYDSLAFQFSRGCPHLCDFCNEGFLYGDRSRVKSSSQIIKELEAVYETGHRGALFAVDDNFIGNIKSAKEVLYKIAEFQKQREYPFSIFTEASINLSKDEELMNVMRDAGFSMVFVGIESPDDEVLKSVGKHINSKTDMLEGVKKIQSQGIEVTAGLILGLDKEPDNINDKTFEFCQEAGITTVMAGLLIPVPGSELYERFKKEGRILRDFDNGDNTHFFDLDYIPDRNRKREDVVGSYVDLLSRLYDPSGKNYFARARALIDNIGPSPAFTRKADWEQIKRGLRSVIKQPFESYGLEYLKFLGYAIKHDIMHPDRIVFPEAVRMGIMGHHFIQITKDYVKEYDLVKNRV